MLRRPSVREGPDGRGPVTDEDARGHDEAAVLLGQADEDERLVELRFGDPVLGGSGAAIEYWAVLRRRDGSDATLAGVALIWFGDDGRVVEQRGQRRVQRRTPELDRRGRGHRPAGLRATPVEGEKLGRYGYARILGGIVVDRHLDCDAGRRARHARRRYERSPMSDVNRRRLHQPDMAIDSAARVPAR